VAFIATCSAVLQHVNTITLFLPWSENGLIRNLILYRL